MVSEFTLQIVPPQVVPGTLGEEERGDLQDTAAPYLRSTAASEGFGDFFASKELNLSITCIAYWGLLYMACCCI